MSGRAAAQPVRAGFQSLIFRPPVGWHAEHLAGSVVLRV
jgi:hypothetical protein